MLGLGAGAIMMVYLTYTKTLILCMKALPLGASSACQGASLSEQNGVWGDLRVTWE